MATRVSEFDMKMFDVRISMVFESDDWDSAHNIAHDMTSYLQEKWPAAMGDFEVHEVLDASDFEVVG